MAQIKFNRCKIKNLKKSEKSGRVYGQVLEEFSTAPYNVSFSEFPAIPENKPVSLEMDVEMSVYEGRATFQVIEVNFKAL